MKKLLLSIVASLVLASNIQAQSVPPVTVGTNAPVTYAPLPSNLMSVPPPGTSSTSPTVSLVDTNSTFGQGLSQTATWLSAPPYYITGGGVYAPGLKNKLGAYIGVYKPVITNSLIAAIVGARVDYVDGGFWMPQMNGQLGVPLHPLKNFTFLPSWLSGTTLTPFAFAGIGLPLSGAVIGTVTVPGTIRDNNGQPTAIIGEGAAIAVYSPTNQNWSIDIVGDRETWSGFAGTQYRFGALYNRHSDSLLNLLTGGLVGGK